MQKGWFFNVQVAHWHQTPKYKVGTLGGFDHQLLVLMLVVIGASNIRVGHVRKDSDQLQIASSVCWTQSAMSSSRICTNFIVSTAKSAMSTLLWSFDAINCRQDCPYCSLHYLKTLKNWNTVKFNKKCAAYEI